MSFMENLIDGEYETAVAAAAYAITTVEEEEGSQKQKKTIEDLAKTKNKVEEQTDRTSFDLSFRWLGGKDEKEEEKYRESNDTTMYKAEETEKTEQANHGSRHSDAGEESDDSTDRKKPTFTNKQPKEKPTEKLRSGKETTMAAKATNAKKPAGFSSGFTNWDDVSNKVDKRETQADAWEKAEKIKANNRYEKMMSVISEWQLEKKAKARRRLEKKQGGPEHKRAKALQHYNNEISRINKIAGEARALAKERKQNDEMKIREKAEKIRRTGKMPGVYFPCC